MGEGERERGGRKKGEGREEEGRGEGGRKGERARKRGERRKKEKWREEGSERRKGNGGEEKEGTKQGRKINGYVTHTYAARYLQSEMHIVSNSEGVGHLGVRGSAVLELRVPQVPGTGSPRVLHLVAGGLGYGVQGTILPPGKHPHHAVKEVGTNRVRHGGGGELLGRESAKLVPASVETGFTGLPSVHELSTLLCGVHLYAVHKGVDDREGVVLEEGLVVSEGRPVGPIG